MSTPAAAAPQQAADEQVSRGQAAEDAGDFILAETLFRRAAEIAPAYPRAWLNLGNALHKQKRLEEAVEAHRKAAGIDAAYLPAWFNLATVLIDLARWTEARAAVDRALALQPDLADAYVLL